MNIFDKWNKRIDVEGLKKDIAEADQNGGQRDFEDPVEGDYEVSIDKIELKESSKGDPMVSIWFKILEGDFKNSRLFMNQVITQGFQISQMNRFIKSMEVFDDDEVEFQNYSQYNDLLMDLFEQVDADNRQYLLSFTKNKKGFSVYKIKKCY